MTRLSPLLTIGVVLAAVQGGLAGPACASRKWASQEECILACSGRWGWPGSAMGSDPWGVVMKPSSDDDMDAIASKACGATVAPTSSSAAPSSTSLVQNVAPDPTSLLLATTTSASSSVLSTSSTLSSSSLSSSSSSRASSSSSSSAAPSKTSSTFSSVKTNHAIATHSTASFTPKETPTTTSSTHKETPTTTSTPPPAPTTTKPPHTTAAPTTSKAEPTSSASSNSGGSSSSGGSVSAAEQQEYLDAHNSIRAQHGASALTWDDTLEAAAQKWANNCVFKHSGGTLGPFGENLAAGTGDGYTITSAVKSWTDEVSQYDPNNPQPSHFTQVVWKASTKVGCAHADCSGIFSASFGKAHFHVCEYQVQGNVIGQFAQQVQA